MLVSVPWTFISYNPGYAMFSSGVENNSSSYYYGSSPTNRTRQYRYADGAWHTGTSLTYASYMGYAFGNQQKSLHFWGAPQGSYSKSLNISYAPYGTPSTFSSCEYNYAKNSVKSLGNIFDPPMNGNNTLANGASTGNSEKGMFLTGAYDGGVGTGRGRIYYYSSDSFANWYYSWLESTGNVSSNYSNYWYYGYGASGACNGNTIIIAGGYIWKRQEYSRYTPSYSVGNATNQTMFIKIASGGTSGITTLPIPATNQAGFGNVDNAYFVLGNSSNNTHTLRIFNYSSQTFTSGSALSFTTNESSSNSGVGTSNLTHGYISSDATGNLFSLNYSSNSLSNETSFPHPAAGMTAVSSVNSGVI